MKKANEIPGKLPALCEDDDSSTKSDLFSSSTEHEQEQEHELLLTGLQQLDALFLDATPPVFLYELQELANIESQYSELLKPRAQSEGVVGSEAPEQKLSTEEVIRLGGERFIQSRSSSLVNDISKSSHPFIQSYAGSFSGLSDQELKDVQLIENLLLSSEKISEQQFERATKLLDWCDEASCSSGSPIQRIVYYFSKALREKIGKETRTIESTGTGKKDAYVMQAKLTNLNMAAVSLYQNSPVYQAAYFSGVQALMDRLSKSRKVHVIDLSIRHGIQTMILMQALASQPRFRVKHLKITAVGTGFEQQIRQTGERLKSFATSIKLSFSFNVIVVEDMLEFRKDLIELDPKEALAVYSSYGLWSMIAEQDRLEWLIKVIRSVNPRVMVVCECAANLNSPTFVNRYIEALFFFGAVFDSFEDCMDRNDENRRVIESMYIGEAIRSIVGGEGDGRGIRHVSFDVWRKFFARFGMKEIKLSMSCLYQTKLVAEKFSCGSCCTFDMDGCSLLIGWKGTPIQCVSAWEFS